MGPEKPNYWEIREELKRAVLAMDQDRIEAIKAQWPEVYKNVWNQMRRFERKQGMKA